MARILVAEDNRVTAEMLDARLSHAGHEIFRAERGGEALERAAAGPLDLILLDLMMPELDGYEVLQRLKSDPLLAAIPVVVLSARAQEQDLLSALALGAADYLTKPFSFRELLVRIDRVLSEGPEPIRMAVRTPSGSVVLGELETGDPRGISVRFHRASSPPLVIGGHTTLAMRSASLSETIELEGTVVGRAEAEPYRSFRFRLDDRTDAAREKTQALLRIIGRRGSQRLYFGSDQPVEVQALAQSEDEAFELQGRLENISATGARVLFKGEVDRQLYCVEGLVVRFELPGCETKFELAASIRHREAAEEGVRYGLRFSEDAEAELGPQQEEIIDYVMTRSREDESPRPDA